MKETSGRPRARVAAVILNSRDPEKLAKFWCDLLDLKVTERLGDPPQYVDCSAIDGGMYLGFQRVTENTERDSRIHLDIETDDVEALTTWIEANGGSRSAMADVAEHEDKWRVMHDPEGHAFCIW